MKTTIIFLITLTVSIPGALGHLNGQSTISILSTLSEIPLRILNILSKEAEAFEAIIKGEEPTTTVRFNNTRVHNIIISN